MAEVKTQVNHRTLLLRMHRQPRKTCDLLAGIRRKRLALRNHIVVVAEVPKKAMPFGITKPFDTVGQQRNGRVAHRGPLHRPSVVADHYLVEREPLFLAPDEE